ncbi:unnamed protein product [Nezara viridula]|uniref:Uncharacterized protein n=1 Tax=Nezara viridula TaxID=85310 RepID=A0A9P0MHT5_NEZVI|nr:unnamed protein product [Nezara viridula]
MNDEKPATMRLFHQSRAGDLRGMTNGSANKAISRCAQEEERIQTFYGESGGSILLIFLEVSSNHRGKELAEATFTWMAQPASGVPCQHVGRQGCPAIRSYPLWAYCYITRSQSATLVKKYCYPVEYRFTIP